MSAAVCAWCGRSPDNPLKRYDTTSRAARRLIRHGRIKLAPRRDVQLRVITIARGEKAPRRDSWKPWVRRRGDRRFAVCASPIHLSEGAG